VILGAAECAFCVAPSSANLLANPSFEGGLAGWEKAWSRDPGAIRAVVAGNGGRAGSVLKVVHSGKQDWCVGQAGRISAAPGDLFEITGWVKTENLAGDVQLSVEVSDGKGQVLDWIYGAAGTAGDHDWGLLKSRFLAPAGTASLRFRITGSGSGTVWVDDLSLVRLPLPVMKAVQSCTLISSVLRLEIDGSTGLMTVTDTAAGIVWRQADKGGSSLRLVGIRRISDTSAVLELTDVVSDLKIEAAVELDKRAPEFTVVLRADPKAVLGQPLDYPYAFVSRPSDLILVPYADGQVFPASDVSFARTYNCFEWKVAMGFAGVTDLNSGYAVMLDTPLDASLGMPAIESLLSVQPSWRGEKGRFGYDRRVTYFFSARGGHTALAKRYRELVRKKGYLEPLRERARINPNLAGLLGAVDLWALDGGLPKDFFDDLHACGVGKALVSLGGGWQAPERVAGTVEKLNSLGYLPGHYDIYTDVWNKDDNPPRWLRTDGYPAEVIVTADGSYQKGWVDKSEGKRNQGYVICTKFHRGTAKERIAKDLKENKYRMRFIDVICAAGPYECYSPAHPVTRREDASARADMLSLVSREFKLVTGSEEIREWAARYSDFSEGTMTERPHSNAGYDWGSSVEQEPDYARFNSSAVYRVPLFELVFHDCHVSTWYTGDGSTKVPDAWAAKDLLNTLYGTMPLWMPSKDQWAKYREKFIASYHNVNTVFEAVGGDEMVSHEFLTPDREVQRTTFSSGVTVTANFGEREYAGDLRRRLVLPRYGYLAQGQDLEAWRAVVQGRVVNFVRTPAKVLLDAGGRSYDAGALECDGAAVLLKTGKGARLVVLSPCKRISVGPGILTARALARGKLYPLGPDRARLAPLAAPLEGGKLLLQAVSPPAIYDIE